MSQNPALSLISDGVSGQVLEQCEGGEDRVFDSTSRCVHRQLRTVRLGD